MKRLVLITAALGDARDRRRRRRAPEDDGYEPGLRHAHRHDAGHVRTQTYTCAGQTIEVSSGRYTGTARARRPISPARWSVVSRASTTRRRSSAGSTAGSSSRASDNRTHTRFTAVITDGKLDGWLSGSAGRRDGRVLGSLAGTFTTAGGLSGGQLGTGTGTNAALLLSHVDCGGDKRRAPACS